MAKAAVGRPHPVHRWLPALVAVVLVAALAAPAIAQASPAGRVSAQTAVQVWTTTTSSSDTLALQLARQPDVTFGAQAARQPRIAVNPATQYQPIQGFGAAMTDSSAYLLDHSPQRAQIMDDLFGPSGARFGFLRLPMGASALSLRNYSYDDMPPGQTDPGLKHFSVAHDTAYIIPVLRQALELNPGLKIDATPWSAPAWMKNGDTYVGDCPGR